MAKNKRKRQSKKKPKKAPILPEKKIEPEVKSNRRTFLLAGAGLVATVGAAWALWPDKKEWLDKDEAKVYLDEQIKDYSPAIQKFFRDFLDPQIVYRLDTCNSLEEGAFHATKMLDDKFSAKELKAYLDSCERFIFSMDAEGSRLANNQVKWQGRTFEESTDWDKLEIISAVLFDKQCKGVSYEHNQALIEPYLFSTVVRKNVGNCATMPMLFAMLAERCKLPVSLSFVGQHMFARFDNRLDELPEQGIKSNPYAYSKDTKPMAQLGRKAGYINIECTSGEGSGVGITDSRYITLENQFLAKEGKPPIVNNLVEHGAYLRTLTRREAIGAFFANQAHYSSQKRGEDRDMTMRFLAYAFYLNNRDHGMIENINQEMRRIATFETRPHYEQLYGELIEHINVTFRANFQVVPKRQRAKTALGNDDPLHYYKKFKKEQDDFLKKHELERQKKQQNSF